MAWAGVRKKNKNQEQKMAFPRDGRAVANDTLFSHPHEVSSVAGFVVFAVHLPSQLISRLCSSPPGWAGSSRPPPQVPGRSPLRQMATPRRRLLRNGFSTSEIENEKGLSVPPPPSFTFLSLPLYPIPFPRVPRRFPSPRTLFSLPCRCAVLSPLLGLGASLLLPSLFRP